MAVPEIGWSGTKGKYLLDLAKTHFDIFITPPTDQNLIYQQRMAEYPTLHIILQNRRRTDTIKDIDPSIPALMMARNPLTPSILAKFQ
jgi:hypothetical protein